MTEVCGEKPWIPGSFDHGEQVFYTGPRCSFPGGDLLVYGALGQVVGRSCLGQILRHVQNRTDKFSSSVSAEPLKAFEGSKIRAFLSIIRGLSQQTASGDEGDDQRVAAVFQGNMHPSVVCLSQVSREVLAPTHLAISFVGFLTFLSFLLTFLQLMSGCVAHFKQAEISC